MKLPHRGAVTLFGLVGAVWFACFTKGAHDLWASTVLAGVLSLLTIQHLKDSLKHRHPIYLPLAFSFGVLFTGFLISSHYSYDMNTTRLELLTWFMIGVTYFLFAQAFREPSFRLQFLKYSGIVMIPLTLLAIGQLLETTISVFTNSAMLAGFALSWAVIFWHFRQKDRIFYGLFGVCLLTLLLARSWWSMISLSVGFAYYYKEAIKRTFSFNPRAVIGFGVISVAILLLSAYLKLGLEPESLKSATDRWGWWMAGLRMAQRHPLAGVGLGSFATAFPYFKPMTGLHSLYAHSFPIQVLSETGLWGTGGSILLAFAYGRLWRRQNIMNAEFNAYRAAVITILCFSLTTIYLEYFIGKLMLFMAMALSLCEVEQKPISLSKTFLNLIEIGLLALVPVWYLPFLASQDHVRGMQYAEKGDRPQAEAWFQKGIRLNPYQDESYAALARLYKTSYQRTHSQSDLSEWRFYIGRALDYKKDSHYLADFATLPKL